MKRVPEPGAQAAEAGPWVAPGVHPAAAAYAASVAQRLQPPSSPEKYTTPRAGGPSPPIPPLDAPASGGLTMADQANLQRLAGQAAPPGSLFQGAPLPGQASPGGPGPAAPLPFGGSAGAGPPPGLLPGDVLPDEARQDPRFQEGPGCMYATAQPALAYQYGVLRGKQRVAPQQLGRANPGLRAETVAGLEALAAAQKQQAGQDAKVEADAAGDVAGAAGRFGQAPESDPSARAPSASSVQEAVKKLDDFDFHTLRDMMMKDLLNNDEQRGIIEGRLEPLDLGDIIVQGYVTQRVPIVPGKFEPEFQSMRADEDLAIKRLIMTESKGLQVSDQYLLDKFSLMGIAIGLRSINGNPLPDHCDPVTGEFDDKLFWTKFNRVARLPFHLLSSLGVNYFWFDVRVRKLFVAERLGNG